MFNWIKWKFSKKFSYCYLEVTDKDGEPIIFDRCLNHNSKVLACMEFISTDKRVFELKYKPAQITIREKDLEYFTKELETFINKDCFLLDCAEYPKILNEFINCTKNGFDLTYEQITKHLRNI